jgi:hypothetical protein
VLRERLAILWRSVLFENVISRSMKTLSKRKYLLKFCQRGGFQFIAGRALRVKRDLATSVSGAVGFGAPTERLPQSVIACQAGG